MNDTATASAQADKKLIQNLKYQVRQLEQKISTMELERKGLLNHIQTLQHERHGINNE